MVLSKKANNKGADQTVQMCRLVCACVVRKPPKTGFLASRPICDNHQNLVNSFIFSQLFGEDDPDQDVSPDTADPELAG